MPAASKMILCLGGAPAFQRTLFFDRFTVDAVNRAVEVRQSASGKSLNVARIVHALGAGAMAMGFAGGNRGEFLQQDLNQAGIGHDFVFVAAPTRICSTLIDRANGTATELVEEAVPVAAEAWDQLLGRLESRLSAAGALVLSGSLPAGGPDDFYARCIRLARRANVPAIVDARGEALRTALTQHPSIVKLNRSELADTLQTPLDSNHDLQQAIKRLLADGASWVIITDGPRGAWAGSADGLWHVSAPSVQVISAIGSGDAFAAGLAVEIGRKRALPDACRLAAACAAANAMTPLPGQAHLKDISTLSGRVQVEQIEP